MLSTSELALPSTGELPTITIEIAQNRARFPWRPRYFEALPARARFSRTGLRAEWNGGSSPPKAAVRNTRADRLNWVDCRPSQGPARGQGSADSGNSAESHAGDRGFLEANVRDPVRTSRL